MSFIAPVEDAAERKRLFDQVADLNERLCSSHAENAQAALYTEIVSGAHVTDNLLSYLLFNRYQMSTPAYRKTKNRLSDMNWKTCRQNLANWADKGVIQLNKLVPALKQIALQEGVDVNADET